MGRETDGGGGRAGSGEDAEAEERRPKHRLRAGGRAPRTTRPGVPGPPSLPPAFFGRSSPAAPHSPRGVTLISGILSGALSEPAGPPLPHETQAPASRTPPCASYSRRRNAQAQPQRRQLPARPTETRARASDLLIGRPAANPGRWDGGRGRGRGLHGGCAAQVRGGGAGERRRRR